MANVELKERVKSEIDKLRPYLQADGGDLEFVELTDENIVKVKLLGACGSCPYSLMTLKQGVEQALKKAIPEVEAVEQV